MPGQTPLEVELAIADCALENPTAGPRTILASVRERLGVGLGYSAVCNS